MKGQLIGEGNTAEVYFWGEKEILKLFRQKFPWEGVEKEYRVSKEVEKLGLPVPRVGQMLELEGRKGITYEKITGISMLELVMRHPLSVKSYSKQLAELHYRMHQCKVQELPKYKEALEWNIRHTQELEEGQRLAVLDLLEKLPEGEALCHGDFHPGNVMTDSDKSVILDWMTACSGNPAIDVARTYMLLKDAVLPDYIPVIMRYMINAVRQRMAGLYLKNYIKLTGLKKEEIEICRIPVIAARLTEWIPETEKKAFLKEIAKYTSKVKVTE